MNQTVIIFCCGFAGSMAVEVVNLYHLYESTPGQSARTRILPAHYRRLGYWVVRLLLAIVAGGLTIAHEIDKPILAVNVGAAAPLIIQALARGMSSPR